MFAFFACGPSPERIESAEVSFRVARQFYSKNDIPQALTHALKSRDADPKNAEVHNFLGLIYFQRNDKREAEKSFKKAVKLDPNFAEAHNHLCLVMIENSEYNEGIEHCKKATESILYPTPERAYHNMGLGYERKGEVGKAIAAYKKGLGYNKKFVMSLRALGNIYVKDKKYFEAIKPLEDGAKICRESPKGIWGSECPETLYLLAMTYVELKKRHEAITALESCLEYSESNLEIQKKCQTSLRAYK
ncbi:MAG: tetratricopeptide repeat protein [Bdellovibrionales bacterium]|nr:tetratricopeptide repeat protein [Bdellovibrionales bacterium]